MPRAQAGATESEWNPDSSSSGGGIRNKLLQSRETRAAHRKDSYRVILAKRGAVTGQCEFAEK